VRAARQFLDEPIGDEALDGLAYRHRAEPERRRKVVDHERSAGRETARDDRLAEADEGLDAEIAGMDRSQGQVETVLAIV